MAVQRVPNWIMYAALDPVLSVWLERIIDLDFVSAFCLIGEQQEVLSITNRRLVNDTLEATK